MIKPRIPSTNEALYLRNDHHEKVKNFKKLRPQQKVAKWLCVKYAQCMKIWTIVWKFDFHWIFLWNMLNVWKYGHLCENLTFIWYLCENRAISKVCAVSEVLCSVSDGHYNESSNCSIYDEEKGRRANEMCVSHLIKWRRAGNTTAQCKNHPMENKPIQIFKI
jgi:hypothetical protein